MKRFSLVKLATSLLLPFLAGAIGSAFTIGEISGWYMTLNKPSFNPPNVIFGPVWTTLYFLMGIAFYDIWCKHTKKSFDWLSAVTFFLLQLVLNTLWSIVFFGMHEIGIALLIILILLMMIILCIISFTRISKRAGLLLIPYLIWVGFATMLNAALLLLNR